MPESWESAQKIQKVSAETVSETTTGQTEGMIRQSAVVGKSTKLCSLLMRAQAHSSSAIHHHGSQDTILYAVSGSGAVVQLDDSGSPQTIKLKPGDWAFIPAYREHMEVNDGDEEFVCSIVRAPGGEPETVNLKDWKGVEK